MKTIVILICVLTQLIPVKGQVKHELSLGSSGLYNLRLDANNFNGFYTLIQKPYASGNPGTGFVFISNYSISYVRKSETRKVSLSYYTSRYSQAKVRDIRANRYAPASTRYSAFELMLGFKKIIPIKKVEIWPMVGLGYQLTNIGTYDRENTEDSNIVFKGVDISFSINCQYDFYKRLFFIGDIGYNHNLRVDQDVIRFYLGLGYRF